MTSVTCHQSLFRSRNLKLTLLHTAQTGSISFSLLLEACHPVRRLVEHHVTREPRAADGAGIDLAEALAADAQVAAWQ